MDEIVERIEREAGVPGLASILAERLSPTDLQSLLLEVFRRRSRSLSPSAVLSQHKTNRFVRPSAISPVRLLEWEKAAFSHLPEEFEPIALAPVAPLGASSAVASVGQDWAIATARNTEVVSDSTNVLALECALRRQELLSLDPRSPKPVHLAASHRLLRGQRYEGDGRTSHFASFALCSAGRDAGNSRFELTALGLHIRFYVDSLRAFLGPEALLRVTATDFSADPRNELLQTSLVSPILSHTKGVECVVDGERTSGRGYYSGLCFHIHAADSAGRWLELVDGGAVDWTQKLLSNAKERLVISGIGSERLCMELGGPAQA
jgi:hypothetical protein